jgi:hypothetical protein
VAELRGAQSAIHTLRVDLTAPGTTDAQLQRDVARVDDRADSAASVSGGPVWAVADHIPFLGRSTRTIRGTASVVRDLAHTALPQAVSVELQLKQTEGRGKITLAPLVAAQAPIAQLATQLQTAAARADRLPRSSGIYPVDDIRAHVQAQLHDLAGQLTTASEVARIAPGMLGADGPRSYFVAFENEAESRGLGGLPGAYAIVRADQGTLSFTHFGSDGELETLHSDVTLPADYTSEYAAADPASTYINSDLSPDFPTAARIWIGLWKAKTGQTLDGAIVLDPTTLSALLKLTGPATLADGTTVSAANVVSLTEKDVYAQFGTDTHARKLFLQEIAEAAADHVVRVAVHKPQQAASVLARMAGERRLLLYSTHPDEQAVLAPQPIAGLLAPSQGPGAVTGPYLMVDVNNEAGNKVDYYLQRTISWRAGSCAGATRDSTVTVALTNHAPPGLSAYAGGRHDIGAGSGSPDGTDRLLVEVRPTVGAGFSSATIDGKPVGLAVYSEQGRPVYDADLVIVPGQTRTLVLHLTEPTTAGPADFVVQPLVTNPTVHVSVPAC